MTRATASVSLRGRERELRGVSDLLDAVVKGSGAAIAFAGGPGAGKSALLAAAIQQAQGSVNRRTPAGAPTGFAVVDVRGLACGGDRAYAGLLQILRQPAAVTIGLPSTDLRTLAHVIYGRSVDRGQQQLAVSSALLAFFTAAARQRPVLCVVDDAHMLDRPSLEALGFVGRRIAAKPIGILFAISDPPGNLLPSVEAMRLVDLDAAASRALLADLVPHGLADDVAGVLAATAAGNPQALTDLARSLSVEQRRGETPPPQRLPPTSRLRRHLASRLVELPEATRWLLLLIAADPDLDVGELIRAAAASGYDIAALEPAERAGLVRATDGAVEFTQPLLRGVVYDEATASQRRAAHQLLASTVDPDVHQLRQLLHLATITDGLDSTLAGRLASASDVDGVNHRAAARALTRAAELLGDHDLSARYLVQAARHAWLGGDPHAARMLVRQVPTVSVSVEVRAQVELLLAEIEMWVGNPERARLQMLTLARTPGDPDLAMNAMARTAEATLQSGRYPNHPDLAQHVRALDEPGEPAERRQILELYAGAAEMVKGRLAAAEGPLSRAMAVPARQEDASTLIHACVAALLLGDEHQAYRLAMRSATVARVSGELAVVPRALVYAAAAEFALGRYDAYKRIHLEALPLAQAVGQDAIVRAILVSLALHAALFGDADTCHSRIAEARAKAGPANVRLEAHVQWALALLELVCGRPAKTLSRLRGRLTSREGDGQLVLGVVAPVLVEAAVQCGRPEAAADVMLRFHRWAVNTGQPNWLALAARCRALLAQNDDDAERGFNEALHNHASSDSPFEWAHTELLFGQDLRRRGRPIDARDHLFRAAERFQFVGGGLWTDHALNSLRASGAPLNHEPPEVERVLTAHQLHIARLVVAGATNREVARTLHLSTRTVDHHMRLIFARLGIRSRTDLAKLLH
jgi:DNA-binding CsgD family transcriptional regulator